MIKNLFHFLFNYINSVTAKVEVQREEFKNSVPDVVKVTTPCSHYELNQFEQKGFSGFKPLKLVLHNDPMVLVALVVLVDFLVQLIITIKQLDFLELKINFLN